MRRTSGPGPDAARRLRTARRHAVKAMGALAFASMVVTGCGTPSALPIPGAPNCTTAPANSFWRADVRGLAVHTKSSTWINTIGAGGSLKADFGSGTWDGGPIGIPFDVIPGSQPNVPVDLMYDDSDPGPYPIPANPSIEGGPGSDGDRHILLVDRDRCRLHELWSAYPNGDGTWRAGSGAHFDLRSNVMRAPGATSADAAGLPVLPGLVRYDEVKAGRVDHAIRITVPRTDNSYVWPASHRAGSGGAESPPMGTWVRLKSTVDVMRFDPAVRPIVTALKVHGGVIADNGSAWYISGVPDSRWNNDLLRTLGSIKGSDFQVVNASVLKKAEGSYEAKPTP